MHIDPLGEWRRTHYSSQIKPEFDGKEVIVFGWVKEIRDLGGIRFLILRDREGSVQVTIPRKKVSKELLEKSDALQTQYSVGVKGIVKKTTMTPRGVEIIPSEIRVIGLAQHPLPLDPTGKTSAEIDVRLDARVLDLSSEENVALFKVEHETLAATRKFLSEKGFLEVHTPRIIATATEGGAALFPVEYFEKQAYLAQSPQLYKEQLTLSFEKVFEIGPFFRAEESSTRRHLSEFISIDIEQAFSDENDVMHLLEETIQYLCKTIKEKCANELAVLKHNIEVPSLPFKRYTYDQIINELAKEGVEIEWGEDIPTPAYRTLGKLHPEFYFITSWPTKAKPFYIKLRDDNPKLTEGFDLMWHWMELASGGTRVHDKDVLIKRLKEQGLDPDSFKYHLKVFDYGIPPHAGWAAGFERVVMMLTGLKNIREVVLFPRDRFRLIP
ncbi:MAG TPA: aspartate--tRNA(Asn) ligase [Candidatus Krumholzibacteriaceae bacterium]|nr:aspartate--tRNA(Asn) ligase [Candidatus Krumholzibacteriaceae bacterium]